MKEHKIEIDGFWYLLCWLFIISFNLRGIVNGLNDVEHEIRNQTKKQNELLEQLIDLKVRADFIVEPKKEVIKYESSTLLWNTNDFDSIFNAFTNYVGVPKEVLL